MLLQSLKKYIFQLFVKEKLLYHAGKPLSVSGSKSFIDGSSSEPWALVVGREHYSEWVKRYPVADESELMSILKSQQPLEHFTIYQVGPFQNRYRTVQCWQIDKNLLDLYPSAVIWLPESLLLKPLFSEITVARIQSPSSFYFAAMQEELLISAAESPILTSADLFCSSNGLPVSDPISIEFTPALLKQNILQISLADFWRGFRFRFTAAFKRELVFLSQVSIGVFIIYQVLASLYLISLSASFSGEEDSQRQQVEQMLKVQKQLQQDTELLAVQQDVLSSKSYSYPVWALMAGLIKQKVELTNVQYNNTKIVLRGQAVSATEVLTFLKQQALVQHVEFESAVRRQEEKESFVVVVQLKTEGV